MAWLLSAAPVSTALTALTVWVPAGKKTLPAVAWLWLGASACNTYHEAKPNSSGVSLIFGHALDATLQRMMPANAACGNTTRHLQVRNCTSSELLNDLIRSWLPRCREVVPEQGDVPPVLSSIEV